MALRLLVMPVMMTQCWSRSPAIACPVAQLYERRPRRARLQQRYLPRQLPPLGSVWVPRSGQKMPRRLLLSLLLHSSSNPAAGHKCRPRSSTLRSRLEV
jgi:hypothetical protein